MKSNNAFRSLLIGVIIIAFLISISLSVKAFTGQIVGGETGDSVSMVSLVFFLIGLFGSFVFLRKFRNNE